MSDEIYITPSDVLEYLYCPRFIYFGWILKIPQHEDNRFKVMEGRKIHEKKALQNTEYLRIKLGVVDKQNEVWMSAPSFHLKGKVDEVLFLSDGTAAPLDYKYAEWKGHIFANHRAQSILYGLLIKENYQREVNRGYIVYTRSNNHLIEMPIKKEDYQKALLILKDILVIIQNEKFPKKTKWSNRCPDCCYKNICVK
jgi:CRISPR-associated exonuclease Cas4